MSEPPCARARELIPEIAAGAASGDERAVALRHLGSCAGCRLELAQTTETVDELLTLAPAREPPPGFEAGVLARIVPRRRRFWLGRTALPAAAAVVALVVAAGLAAGAVWWRTADDRALAASHRDTLRIAHGKAFTAAPLTMGSGEIATLFAYEGSPSWVYTTFRRKPPEGEYEVSLTLMDGRQLELRPLVVTEETQGWGARSTFRVRDLDVVEFRLSGSVVMSARFGLD